jgi:hypothetical protein
MATLRITPSLALILILMTSCNNGAAVVPVKGTVTRAGKPIKNLLLRFYPDVGRSSTAITDADGRFELAYASDQKGAPLGAYKVVVSFRPRNPLEESDLASGIAKLHPDQEEILEKYGNLATTKITVNITQATNDLELKLD